MQRRVAVARRALDGYTPSSLTASPGDIVQAAQQTDAEIENINNAVQTAKKAPPSEWRAGWDAFRAQWKTFFPEVNSFAHVVFTRITHADFTNKLVDQIKSFQEQVATWGKQAQKYIHEEVPGGVQPGPGSSNALTYIGIAAIAIVGLFIIGKVIHTVAFGNAELEEAEKEAERIMEQKRRKKHSRSLFSIA